MTREEVKARVEEIGIFPGVRVDTAEEALYCARTLYNAGIPVVEITMTVPDAVNVIAQLIQEFPDMVVGAARSAFPSWQRKRSPANEAPAQLRDAITAAYNVSHGSKWRQVIDEHGEFSAVACESVAFEAFDVL